MSFKIVQCIITFSTLITTLVCGILMIKEKDYITFSQYDNYQKVALGCIIYSELVNLIVVLYFIFKKLWSGMLSCCVEKIDESFKFSCINFILILSSLAGNFYLFYYICDNKILINDHITIIAGFLIGNMFLIFFLGLLNCFYINCCKKDNNKNIEYQNI